MSHPLVARLQDKDPNERIAACRAIATDPSSVLLLEDLARVLGDPVKAVARAASDVLAELGASANEVFPILRDALLSDHVECRFRAAFTIARLEPPTPRLLPALVDALSHSDGDVRWAAARLIVDAGRLHHDVLPLLLGLARASEHAAVRRMATFCLRELAPDRPEAAREFLAASYDDDLHVRRAALTAIPALIAPPPEIGARLVEVLTTDKDLSSRRLAALALGELGVREPTALPDAARDALRRVGAREEDAELRRCAAHALERLPH